MIVTFPTVWAHLIGQLLYYMGPNNILFGSDSMWYGGPQWQIEALWRSQIPDNIRQTWGYPQLTDDIKRQILGLNSARLYGLSPATSQYTAGGLPNYLSAPELQPGGRMDTVLRGVGYPEPVNPASLTPEDRFAKLKSWADEMGHGRSNTRNGWMRTRV
jgi:Amidohydrolase